MVGLVQVQQQGKTLRHDLGRLGEWKGAPEETSVALSCLSGMGGQVRGLVS